MKQLQNYVLSAGIALFLVLSASAVRVGDPAPTFAATDSNGSTQRLSDYKGKFVVSHSISENVENKSAATANAHGVYLSSELIHAMISPVVFAKPL